MIGIKKRVSRYFQRRRLVLTNLAGAGLTAKDDFAELYILFRMLTLLAQSKVKNAGTSSGKRSYRVPAAPSNKWDRGSYFQVTATTGEEFALRTGFEVYCRDGGTVELDVLLVPSAAVRNKQVRGRDVASAFEAKTHAAKLSSTVANEVLGKAVRVFGLPITDLGDKRRTPRYCLVTVKGSSQNALFGLDAHGILSVDFISQLDAHLEAVAEALALPTGP